eukprot:gene16207-22043_t
MEDLDVIYSGILRKKGSTTRVNYWSERFFVLKGHTLYYFIKQNDADPKGSFNLQPSCHISKISTDMNRKRKQFIFKITWRIEEENDEIKDENLNNPLSHTNSIAQVNSRDTVDLSKDKANNKTKKSIKDDKSSTGTGSKVAAAAVGGIVVGALTSGIGLLAGMMVVGMGAAAGGGAVAMNQLPSEKEKILVLACDSYEEAQIWVNKIEMQINNLLGDNILNGIHVGGSNRHYHRSRHIPRPEVHLEEVEEWITNSKWKLYSTFEGARLQQLIHRTDDDNINNYESFFNYNRFVRQQNNHNNSNENSTLPCLRINIGINGSPGDTFSSIMNFIPALRTGVIKSIRVVEVIDNFNDVIHMKLEPIFTYPTWSAPRDFCLMRYWKDNSDGSYLICLDSTTHNDCPLVTGYVRGDLHAAYLITPPKSRPMGVQTKGMIAENEDEESTECLLVFIAQMDPKGWVWQTFGYQYAFLQQFMLQVLDIRDALDSERFLQVHFDPVNEMKVNPNSIIQSIPQQGSIASIPPSVLPPEMWGESDSSTFKVRAETYNTDKVKISSAPSLFKLIAIDLFEVPEATHNISAHPRNRVYQALQRGEDSWVFVVNIMVPGPPFLSFVVYFLGDKTVINADSPFGRIARPFFFGNDDEFRSNRFKLIPKVVDGNMIIKMAVKDTPTLLGNKLKNYYYK